MIGSRLTKHLTAIFGEIDEEIHAAFQDYMPDCGDGTLPFNASRKHNAERYTAEWTPVHVIDVARDVVARASNRVFVGLPVCEYDWLDPAQHLRCYSLMVPQAVTLNIWTCLSTSQST